MMDAVSECIDTDLTSWKIGPYHGALPGPIQVHMELDGEIIVSAKVETGFLHRGLEKELELHSWQVAMVYVDHLDPEGAAFAEQVLCLAVEEIGDIFVPPRACTIRVIVQELSRISVHLNYMARLARSVGADTVIHYILRDREKILDLFELLCGARFSLNYFRFGGVRSDMTEGFVERIFELCDLLKVRLKEYNDLFSFNLAFLERAAALGILSMEMAFRHGVTGPNARAVGISFDVRKTHPYSGYAELDFNIPTGGGTGKTSGGVYERFILRIREIEQSVEILRQAAEKITPGAYLDPKWERNPSIPSGEAYSRVESARGLLGCHVVSDGGAVPNRIQFRPPSIGLIEVFPQLIGGTRIEDLPVVLASLDISISEIDR